MIRLRVEDDASMLMLGISLGKKLNGRVAKPKQTSVLSLFLIITRLTKKFSNVWEGKEEMEKFNVVSFVVGFT